MKTWEDMPIFMTVKQVAALFNVSPKSIYELVARKAIPHKRVGRQIRFNRDRIRKWDQEGGE